MTTESPATEAHYWCSGCGRLTDKPCDMYHGIYHGSVKTVGPLYAHHLTTPPSQSAVRSMPMVSPHDELTVAADQLKACVGDEARQALDRVHSDILGFAWLLASTDDADEERPHINTLRRPACVEVDGKQIRADQPEWYVATDTGNYGPCSNFADALRLARQVAS